SNGPVFLLPRGGGPDELLVLLGRHSEGAGRHKRTAHAMSASAIPVARIIAAHPRRPCASSVTPRAPAAPSRTRTSPSRSRTRGRSRSPRRSLRRSQRVVVGEDENVARGLDAADARRAPPVRLAA